MNESQISYPQNKLLKTEHDHTIFELVIRDCNQMRELHGQIVTSEPSHAAPLFSINSKWHEYQKENKIHLDNLLLIRQAFFVNHFIKGRKGATPSVVEEPTWASLVQDLWYFFRTTNTRPTGKQPEMTEYAKEQRIFALILGMHRLHLASSDKLRPLDGIHETEKEKAYAFASLVGHDYDHRFISPSYTGDLTMARAPHALIQPGGSFRSMAPASSPLSAVVQPDISATLNRPTKQQLQKKNGLQKFL